MDNGAFNKKIKGKILPEVRMNFQHRFAQRRKELRLSQRDVASKVGVSMNTIHAYENGNLPSGSNLLTVAWVLECSVDWLLGLGSDGRYISLESESPEQPLCNIGEFIRVNQFNLHQGKVEAKDKLLFSRKWLENISSGPLNVRLVFPNPSGLTDSIMLIDQGVTSIYQGCQYLVEINGHYSVNRVSIRPENILHLSTIDGQNNLDFAVSSSEVRIIGRLILVIHKL